MKRIKQIVLSVLYFVLMLSSLGLHMEAVKNPERIGVYNLLTILIFLVTGGMILLIYRSMEQRRPERAEEQDATNEGKADEESQQLDWEKYLMQIEGCGLTRREAETGYLMAMGYSNAMIAKELFIAETTVKKHVSHIFEKTGTDSRKTWKAFIFRE